MSLAVFPGSFDPVTFGHLDIIERASKLFEKVDVALAVNPEKKYAFSMEERLKMLKVLTLDYKNVSVNVCKTLIVDYAKKIGANVLLRGVRNSGDFAYEFDLALINHNLNPKIETLFIPTDQKYVLLRSSAIKELAMFGGDVSTMVPPIVQKALKQKYGKSENDF